MSHTYDTKMMMKCKLIYETEVSDVYVTTTTRPTSHSVRAADSKASLRCAGSFTGS